MEVDRFTVEIEPEVRDWLHGLPDRHYSTRALWAQKICESEHEPAHEEFSRIVPKGRLLR
ncbi:hypothetical protein ACFRAR_34865 [Kitasatospora sp. NPDC056651]|uniref:hypothetical protein n=1 Tax=Kitasatospora sp. NPDC056651 TaxID=3345892 RepID=UPI0036CD3357